MSSSRDSRHLINRLFLVLILCGTAIYFIPDSLLAVYSNHSEEKTNQPADDPSSEKKLSHPKKFDYVPGEVLVKFRKNISSRDMASIQTQSDAEELGAIPSIRVRRVRGKRGQSTEELIAMYSKRPEVEYVEPNGIVHAMLTPNDSRFPELWGMNNTGQTGGVVDADIDAPEAWDFQTGNADVIVANIDSGADYNHPDLAANMWTNPGEIAGNGIDDDGNGFIDDVRGWNFVDNTNNPMDDNGHGTHTSGTIAAAGDNGTGVVGVSWRAKIMPVKHLDASGDGTFENTAKAILYASQMGAKISNNSYGCGPSSDCFSQTIQNALEVANQRGMLFVVAAGNKNNNNDNTPTYPCNNSVPNVLCVAATDQNDQKASFSNYGAASVALGAPGVNILSTVPTGNCENCNPSGYNLLNGTSMATPHVSGAAALVLAQFPSLTVDQLKSVLTGSVDPVPALAAITQTGGRLNVNNALRSNFIVTVSPSKQTIVIGQTTNFMVNVQSLNNFNGQVTLSLTSPNPNITGNFSPNPVALSPNGSIQATLAVTTTASATRGAHLLTIRGTGPLETRSTIIELDLIGPDFTISIDPTSRATGPSSTASFDVLVSSFDGYSAPVTLSLTATDPNISGSFNPNPVTPPVNSTVASILTVTTASVPIGSYTLTIQATDGVKTHTRTAILAVDLGAFSITGSLQTDRIVSTATLLLNGKVLITGGVSSFGGPLASAELYDPVTGMFSFTGSMGTGRYLHTATLLSNGKVFIAGGGSGGVPASSAELYDPNTGSFTPTGSMGTGRVGHTATLLPKGEILITGGTGPSDYLASAELYNPVTGAFIPTGPMTAARISHTATLLSNGKVLIAGGSNADGDAVMAELYDPDTGSFSLAGSMSTPRSNHTATLLSNGNVLIAGGTDNTLAELYNPATGLFIPTGSMLATHSGHTATLLTNGNVLIAGGTNNSFAELYNPATGLFIPTGSMLAAHLGHTATLLTNGNVLIAGGSDPDGFSIKSAELYSVLDAVSLTPVNITTEPSVAQSFTSGYSDPDGYQNITDASLSLVGATHSETLHYNPATNRFTLQGTGGDCAPGQATTLSNLYLALNCGASSVSGSGTNLTVTYNLTPQHFSSGAAYRLILGVMDQSGVNKNKDLGYWVVNRRPSADSVEPMNSTTTAGTQQTFASVYSDPDGYENIAEANFYLAGGMHNEWLHYIAGANIFFIMGAPGVCTPGQATTLSNGFLTLDCANSSVSGWGTMLTITFHVTPQAPSSGINYNIFTGVSDQAGAAHGLFAGTWVIQ